jgi:predicted TIM-barrel fold metal-dependent hydrolase
VVCFYPKTLGTSLDSRVIDRLFTILERRRLPVALFETDWIESADIAARFPDIPFILHRPDYRNRQYLSLLKDTPNLYVSLAPNFAPYRGIETIVRECGSDRMLFASGYPENEPGAPIGALMYSSLEDDAVEKIAHGNMERLIDEVACTEARRGGFTPPGRGKLAPTASEGDEPAPTPSDGLTAAVWERTALPLPGIIDMHTHYSRWIQFPIWGGLADDLVEEMDRVGIEKAVLAPQPCMTPSLACGNDGVLEAMKKHPDRLLGYAACYPVDEDTGLKEVERCVNEGMVGIKMHTSAGLPYTFEGYAPVWRYADERGIPVLLHTWGDLDKMRSIFDTYRHVPVLLGHSGAVDPSMYAEYARMYPNLWLELCLSRSPFGLVEFLVREVGADRILYGSDAPWMPFGHQLGRVLFADISEEDKKKILIENPKRVIEKAG